MRTTIETIKETMLTPLTNAPLIVAVGIGLLSLCWLLRKWPKFPNDWIPVSVTVVGGVVGYFVVPMQGPADWAFQVANPEAADMIRRISVGLAVAVIAFLVPLKRIEKWIAAKVGNGDTTFVNKTDDTNK